jgi:hypothetical protein
LKSAAVSGELKEFTLIGLSDCHKLARRLSAAEEVAAASSKLSLKT